MKNKGLSIWYKLQIIVLIVFMVCVSTITMFDIYFDKSIKIYIGYQSVTSQTWSALIIKNKRIFEKKLQELYPNKKFKIIWSDEISGAVINTAMISGKCHFGFMGDMPILLNLNKARNMDKFDSRLLSFCGKGVNGKNQSILIPSDSEITSAKDLKGKTISVPIGSSAHFMLLNILEKYNLTEGVNIIHQDIALSSHMLNSNKVDAFSIWAPYPNFLESKGIGKTLVSGEETGVDYQAGVVVDNTWANKNLEIVKCFIESIQEANIYVKSHREESINIFVKESGFSKDVVSKEIDNIEWISDINEQDIITLQNKLVFLQDLGQISSGFEIKDFLWI